MEKNPINGTAWGWRWRKASCCRKACCSKNQGTGQSSKCWLLDIMMKLHGIRFSLQYSSGQIISLRESGFPSYFFHPTALPLVKCWNKCFQAFLSPWTTMSGTWWLVLFPFLRQRQSSALGQSQLWSWDCCLAFISFNHDVFITAVRAQKASPGWGALSESPCYSNHHEAWRTTSKAIPWQYSVGTEDKALVAFYLENQPQRCLKAI